MTQVVRQTFGALPLDNSLCLWSLLQVMKYHKNEILDEWLECFQFQTAVRRAGAQRTYCNLGSSKDVSLTVAMFCFCFSLLRKDNKLQLCLQREHLRALNFLTMYMYPDYFLSHMFYFLVTFGEVLGLDCHFSFMYSFSKHEM